MTRQRPPTAGADPMNDLARHRLRRLDIATPIQQSQRLDRMEHSDPTAPRNRPVVSGSRTDGTALARLLRVLHDAGTIDDRTTE